MEKEKVVFRVSTPNGITPEGESSWRGNMRLTHREGDWNIRIQEICAHGGGRRFCTRGGREEGKSTWGGKRNQQGFGI